LIPFLCFSNRGSLIQTLSLGRFQSIVESLIIIEASHVLLRIKVKITCILEKYKFNRLMGFEASLLSQPSAGILIA